MRALRLVVVVMGGLALACAGKDKDLGDGTDDTGDTSGDTSGGNGGDSGDSGGGNGGDSGSDSGDTPDYTWTPVLINFDENTRQVDVATVYPEVTFEVEAPYALYSWNYSTYSRSTPMSVYTAQSAGGAGVRTDIRFVFTRPVRALEFYTLGDQTNGVYGYVDVLTESGATDTVPLRGDGGATSAELCDLTAWDDIVEITLRDIEDAYTVNIDDISFEQRDR